MQLPGRKLSVVLRRNENKDERVGAIEYTGYDAHWPSGYRIRTLAFDRFCKIGMRYLLGRERPTTAALDLFFVPLAGRGEAPPRVPGCRVRVMYLERVGGDFRLFLSDETRTEIVFDLHQDEAAVLEWIGARAIADRTRQWFAFYAVKRVREEFAVPVPAPRRQTAPARVADGGWWVVDGADGKV